MEHIIPRAMTSRFKSSPLQKGMECIRTNSFLLLPLHNQQQVIITHNLSPTNLALNPPLNHLWREGMEMDKDFNFAVKKNILS